MCGEGRAARLQPVACGRVKQEPAGLLGQLTINTTSFEAFQADALAAGFDEVLERHWARGTVLDTHSHAFGVGAVVTQGEMWLRC